MKKYKLKVDARHFFEAYESKEINTLEYWNKKGIPVQLLDEVSMVFVEFGRYSGEASKHLSEFSKDGAIFEFTVHAPDITMQQYNKMDIPKLMDMIQKELDKYFKQKYT